MHNFNKEDLQSVICLLSWMLVCFSVLYITTAVNLNHYPTPEFPNHRAMWYRTFRKTELEKYFIYYLSEDLLFWKAARPGDIKNVTHKLAKISKNEYKLVKDKHPAKAKNPFTVSGELILPLRTFAMNF